MTMDEPEETHAELDAAQESQAEVLEAQDRTLYEESWAALLDQDEQAPARGQPWLLLGTMLLFAAGVAWSVGFSSLAQIWWYVPLLVGVLLLHELGHYWGMVLFGYRDVRMFFVPFFGAGVSGHKGAVPAWQEAIVLLLGPLPGIILGVLLGLFHPSWLNIPVAFFLVLINGFNLLPFAPLDGGKLLQLLVVSRHPVPEGAFYLFSGVGLALYGWSQGWWIPVMVGSAFVIGAASHHGERRRRFTLVQGLPELPATLSALSGGQRFALFRGARNLVPDAADSHECAEAMRTLHDQAVTKRPGGIATGTLLAVYAAAAAMVLWSLSDTFHWTEPESPAEWSQRRIEAHVKGPLNLDHVVLNRDAPGRYSGTGETAQGTQWTLTIVQDKPSKSLQWSAESGAGVRRSGHLRLLPSGTLSVNII